MDVLLNFISEELIYALGWTVMHSIWQGFLIAILMAVIFQVLRKKSASVRYEVATVSLFMVLVSAICTFIWYYGSVETMISQEVSMTGLLVQPEPLVETSVLQNFTQSCIAYFNNYLPVIVLIWLLGVSFFILRLFGGLAYIQRLKNRRLTLLSPYWQMKVQKLALRIPAKKVVQIFESASVKVPMVIGYFKPYILLPIGAINQLSEQEVEAIIAHELGHVYRNDFLINILLSFIEVFFYYHPAVWWISGNIRLERENCCDDIAIRVCGNSLTYAKALVRLQELNVYTPTFAMPFSGQKNQLLNRIKRILNQPQNRSNILERLAATCFLFLAVVFMSVSPNNLEQSLEEVDIVEVENDLESRLNLETDHIEYQDTIPEEKKVLRGNVLEITREDGEISEVVLDGKIIPKEVYEQYDAIETEGKIIVKGDDLPDLSSDILLPETAASDTESRFSNSWKEKKKSGDQDSRMFIKQQQVQTVTSNKNKDGQRVIILETNGREPVEIIVDDQEDVIIVEGNELEEGDKAVIIEEGSSGPKRIKRYMPKSELEALETFDFDTRHSNRIFRKKSEPLFFYLNDDNDIIRTDSFYWNNQKMSKEEWKAKMNANLLGKQKDMIALSEHYDEELQDKLAIIKEEYQIKKEQEKEKLAHMLNLAERQRESLAGKENRLKKKYDALIERRLKHNEEHQALLEKLKQERRFYKEGSTNKIAYQIATELKQDGLIDDKSDFSFSITGNRLKINGKKQSKAIFKKYKKLYKELTGNKLTNKSKYQINFSN